MSEIESCIKVQAGNYVVYKDRTTKYPNLPYCQSVSQSVSLPLVTTFTVSHNHIASDIQVPHCL